MTVFPGQLTSYTRTAPSVAFQSSTAEGATTRALGLVLSAKSAHPRVQIAATTCSWGASLASSLLHCLRSELNSQALAVALVSFKLGLSGE